MGHGLACNMGKFQQLTSICLFTVVMDNQGKELHAVSLCNNAGTYYYNSNSLYLLLKLTSYIHTLTPISSL
jgi:hypothetical protein